jgi:hypothetical protein
MVTCTKQPTQTSPLHWPSLRSFWSTRLSKQMTPQSGRSSQDNRQISCKLSHKSTSTPRFSTPRTPRRMICMQHLNHVSKCQTPSPSPSKPPRRIWQPVRDSVQQSDPKSPEKIHTVCRPPTTPPLHLAQIITPRGTRTQYLAPSSQPSQLPLSSSHP